MGSCELEVSLILTQRAFSNQKDIVQNKKN
jgi:hypothetical protein